MKENPVVQRLVDLRAAMRERDLTHYLVPSSDEHINEYLPAWGLRREFMSGFSGSAGDLLVGCDNAWLFTDGSIRACMDPNTRLTNRTPASALGNPSPRSCYSTT